MTKKWRFSPSTRGWYLVGLDYPNAPNDLLDVPAETWAALQGKQIEPGPDGMPRAYEPPALTFDQRKASLLAAVDAHLNAAARAKGYDSITSAALRAALPASAFHDEGVAFGTWMDAVYAKCYAVLAQVQSQEIAEPTQEQLIAMLPVLVLPA